MKRKKTNKSKRQIGKTKSLKRDKKIKAKHPGKRISKNGKVYYEKRANRSDVDRRKRL